MITTLLVETDVVGARGATGTKAHKTEKLEEKSDMPKELLDCTLKLYVVPVMSPVAVNEAEVTPDCNTE